MNNPGNIYLEVQATLLNSECSPEYAVERALLAVVDFALNEGTANMSDLVRLTVVAHEKSEWK